jgi:hypothetical protein
VWWIRVRGGVREDVTEPKAITADADGPGDPRRHLLGADDVGCTFKVKCKPLRQDGAVGELCTSKPSPKVEA